MREYQVEYEAYMKKVTDGFITIQTETTTHEFQKDTMVVWNCGVDFEFTQNYETFRDGNLMEERRKYNSEVAKKYLQENSLTYDEWFMKFKKM